jgi:polysaccharide export outer membrane protein
VAEQSDVAALARSAGGGSDKLSVVDSTGLNRRKSDQPAGAARRGDIIDATTPKFELTGHVRYPGTRALAGAGTLRQALGDGTQSLAGLYPLFGLIERQDRTRMTSRVIAFSPHEVISGVSDRPLSDGDRVRLFSAAEIRSLMRSIREPVRDKETPADPMDQDEAAVRSLMIEHAVIVHGAVRQPGSYPVEGQVRLETLLATAGGLTAQADANAIEITSPESQSDQGALTSVRRVVSLQAANGMTTEIGLGKRCG